MKKIILLVTILVSTLAFGQEEVPNDIIGKWYSLDGEILVISRDLDKVVFTRSTKSQIVTYATGTITLSPEGELHIKRNDIEDEYKLVYSITGTSLVITQPRSVRAWLWTKIQ